MKIAHAAASAHMPCLPRLRMARKIRRHEAPCAGWEGLA
jgi:hypothetical protein